MALKMICDCAGYEPDPQPCRCRDSANLFWREREALWFWRASYYDYKEYRRVNGLPWALPL